MIVKCEECKSEFNLDGTKLKESGSKVRCSVCESVFTVYPQKSDEVPEGDIVQDDDLEETVELDSPPLFDDGELEEGNEGVADAFEQAFSDSLEDDGIDDIAPEDESEPTVSLDSPPDLTGDMGDDAAEGIDDPVKASNVPSGKGRRPSHLLLIILIIILVIIIGSLAIFFVAPNLLPDSLSFLKPVSKDEMMDTGIRRLTFKDVNGSFAQSNKAGQLFVIKGHVVNDDSKTRSYILLKGLILDEKGETVKRKLAYAGNTFAEQDLMGMSFEKIEEGLKNREGKGGINVNISPGSSVPFMIVFTDLPDNLSEFIVEAVSTSQGK
ncbi:DUF3426 domain-containing protein [Thermodesulfobacteriota bacterium]